MILFKTGKYEIEEINNSYRVYNYSRVYERDVPHIEVPIEFVRAWDPEENCPIEYSPKEKREFMFELANNFNEFCAFMFDDEWNELYYEEKYGK